MRIMVIRCIIHSLVMFTFPNSKMTNIDVIQLSVKYSKVSQSDDVENQIDHYLHHIFLH